MYESKLELLDTKLESKDSKLDFLNSILEFLDSKLALEAKKHSGLFRSNIISKSIFLKYFIIFLCLQVHTCAHRGILLCAQV